MAHTEMLRRIWTGSPGHHADLWLTIDGEGVNPRIEFAERSGIGMENTVSAPYAALDALVNYLERSPDRSPVGPGEQRLIACLHELGARDASTDSGPWRSGIRTALTLFDLANVEYEHRSTNDDGSPRHTDRYVPLRVTRSASGTESRLLLRLHPTSARAGVAFVEQYTAPGSYQEVLASYSVEGPISSIEGLVRSLEARLARSPADNLDDGLVACLTDLIERGELPGGQARGTLRDTVAEWFRQAGFPHTVMSIDPPPNLLDHGDGPPHSVRLSLEFDVDQFSPMITFTEQRPSLPWFQTTTPYAALETLLAHVEAPPGPLSAEERLVAYFRSLVASGELGADLPPGASRDRVAALYAEAGIPTDDGFSERSHTLVEVRRASDSWFALTLKFTFETVSLDESYEYTSRSDDPGEYIYSVRVPHSSLGRLVAYLESRLDRTGAGDPQQRFIDCLTEAVRRGELGDGMPKEANCQRVAAWCAEAGVPSESDFWVS